METIEQNLAIWQTSLMRSIPLGGLLSRNPVAYKWKAPFRSWVLREAAFWRVTDLLSQSYALHQQKHMLGARILLRSSFETLASLIYLNLNMQAVIDGKLDFHQFSQITIRQIAGSKNQTTNHGAVNILTMLDKGDKKFPGLRRVYDNLSESAHPNFEGMIWGYSKVDHDEYETRFTNRWMELFGSRHLSNMELCMMVFHYEYDEVWTELIGKLENWIVANNEKLDATKDDPLPG